MYISTTTIEDIVEEKINLLYDFRILRRGKYKSRDSREQTVRRMLLACGNENRMETALHGIHIGDYTLNELLRMKGFAI